MRVDTTVVETPIRYPSDSRLCEDVAQGVCREIERLRSLGVTAPSGFCNVRRSVTRRVREITHVSRRPIARDAKRRPLRRPYGRLLTIVRRTIRQAIETVKRASRPRRPLSGRGQGRIGNLGRLAPGRTEGGGANQGARLRGERQVLREAGQHLSRPRRRSFAARCIRLGLRQGTRLVHDRRTRRGWSPRTS